MVARVLRPRWRRRLRPDRSLLASSGGRDRPIHAIPTRPRDARVTIFTIWFQDFPNNLVTLLPATAMAGRFVYTFARSAMVAEGGRQGRARKVTSANTKRLFAVLFVPWA